MNGIRVSVGLGRHPVSGLIEGVASMSLDFFEESGKLGLDTLVEELDYSAHDVSIADGVNRRGVSLCDPAV
jgi:hypothetical protein